MAGHTTHYNLIKPTSAERVAVGDINDNSDIIDGNLFTANERADQMADDYNASETYNTGDYVRRENYLYKCNTDNTTGTWDATKWDRVKVMDEITQGGGGGSSTLAGLNDVDLSSPTDGQLLGYNATTGKWENVTGGGGGGSSTFAGLNDVNVQGVQNGDIARYNSTTGKWEKADDLTNLELTVSQLSASTLSYDANNTIKEKIDSKEDSLGTGSVGNVLTQVSASMKDWVTPHYIPAGGSSGQVLKKASNDNYATSWDDVSADDVAYENTQSGLSATDVQGAIDKVVDFDKYVPFGGNYLAEAQPSGRIKVTTPYYNRRGYNVATLNQTNNIYVSIYGTKSVAGVYVNLYSCNIRYNRHIEIVFELVSGTLSTYTDLGKGFLLELDGMTITLSKS